MEIHKIDDPAREKVITEKEARRGGLLWKRSKTIANRLVYDPAERVEETDEEAIEAGKRMGMGIQKLLAQVPDLPDRYIPRGPKAHKRTKPPKQDANSSVPLKRVRLQPAYEDEDISKEVSRSTGCAAEQTSANCPIPTYQRYSQHPHLVSNSVSSVKNCS